jgi:hypothetical protein
MQGLLVAQSIQSMHGQEVVMAGGDLVFIPFDSSGRRTVGEVVSSAETISPLSIASLSVACLCVRWLFGWSRAPLACSISPPSPLLSRFLVSLSLASSSSLYSLLYPLSSSCVHADWLHVSLLVHWLLMHVRSVAEWVVPRIMSHSNHVPPHACHFPPALPPHIPGMAWPRYGIPSPCRASLANKSACVALCAITRVCVVGRCGRSLCSNRYVWWWHVAGLCSRLQPHHLNICPKIEEIP